MKYFLILLIGCCSFFAAAQDTLVHISPRAARSALAAWDSLQVYKLRVSAYEVLVADFKAKDEVREGQLKNLAKSLENATDENTTRKNETVDCKNDLRDAFREIRKQKREKVIIVIGGVVLIILVAI